MKAFDIFTFTFFLLRAMIELVEIEFAVKQDCISLLLSNSDKKGSSNVATNTIRTAIMDLSYLSFPALLY